MFRKIRERIYEIKHRLFLNNVIRSSRKPPIRKGVSSKKRKEETIVSLTSYEPRLPYLSATLNTLLKQTVKPNRIIVWLSCEISMVPDRVLKYRKYGIEFRHVQLDLKGHKKYFYALREFPRATLITVDDDVLYSKDLISSLLKTHRKFPTAVVGRRVHDMRFQDGSPAPYSTWRMNVNDCFEPSYSLFCTGCAGILYPSGCLDVSLLDSSRIIRYCLGGDDIWLKYMSLLNNTKTVWAPNDYSPLLSSPGTQKTSLSQENVVDGRNDEYITLMESLFHNNIEESTHHGFYKSKGQNA